MHIRIAKRDWGTARLSDLEVLLTDVASHLMRPLRERPCGTIVVEPTASKCDEPITPYRLSLRKANDSQSSWPLARWLLVPVCVCNSHSELCHVLSKTMSVLSGRTEWLVPRGHLRARLSLHGLRRMAVQRWITCPPKFPGRSDYAGSLASYAEDLLSQDPTQAPTPHRH